MTCDPRAFLHLSGPRVVVLGRAPYIPRSICRRFPLGSLVERALPLGVVSSMSSVVGLRYPVSLARDREPRTDTALCSLFQRRTRRKSEADLSDGRRQPDATDRSM